MIPKHLILSGGAALTAAFIGAVRALEQYAQIQGKVFSAECSTFTGTSGGSVLAPYCALTTPATNLKFWLRNEAACCIKHGFWSTFVGKFGGCDSAIMGTFCAVCAAKDGKARWFWRINKATGRHLFVRVLNVDSGRIDTKLQKPLTWISLWLCRQVVPFLCCLQRWILVSIVISMLPLLKTLTWKAWTKQVWL